MSKFNNGILNCTTIQKEDNFNILNDKIDIYPADYSFPIKTGDVFPDDKLRERANRSLTNRLLYKNQYDKIFSMYLTTLPEIDPTYGFQIRDIVTQLPFFRKTVVGFEGLCVGNNPLFDFPDIENDSCDRIINNSNMKAVLRSVIEGDFMDACNLYKVTLDNNNKPVVQQIPTKNFIIYNDPNNIISVYSYLTFSILKDRIEFIEYKYNGEITKHVFSYGGGVVGKELCEPETTQAFNGKYNEAPVVLFSNNIENLNDVYGNDRFSTFDSSVLAVSKAFSNLLRLDDRLKEMIRKVPDSATTRDFGMGNMFVNRGTITYPDNTDPIQRPDIEYIIPDISANITAGIEIFKQAVKTLSMSSGLSNIFYDFEKAGTGNLSGKALESMIMPTLIEVKNICSSKEQGVKMLARKLCLLHDIDISIDKIDLDFNEGLPKDEKEQTDIITERLTNKTIGLVDAIRKLDRIPYRVAKEQARELMGLGIEKQTTNDNRLDKENIISDNNDVSFSTEEAEKIEEPESGRTLSDLEMAGAPTNFTM